MTGASPDVVVLGNGAAGSLAAVAAAQSGCSVLLVAASPGATALSSGAIDLAGRQWGPSPAPGPLSRVMGEFVETDGHHPLSRLGLSTARIVAEQVNQLLVGEDFLYSERDWSHGPWCAVTPWGDIHPCWLGQATQLDLARRGGRLGVIDAGPDSVLPAWLACGRLELQADRWGMGASFLPVRTRLPPDMDSRRPLAVAQWLESDPQALGQLGQALRVAQRGQVLDALLMPPWVAIDGGPRQLRQLSDLAGLPVYETLGLPGDPCGLRLSRELEGLVRRAGVTVVRGRALSLLSAGDRLSGVVLEGQAQPLAAAACVLACGGLAGGGLVFDGKLTPSLAAGLPLAARGKPWRESARPFGTDPTPLFGQALGAVHPLLAAGVSVDHRLRPLGPEGVCWSNVHVAGALLADHDPVADGSGLSTALITGFCAGRWASGQELSP